MIYFRLERPSHCHPDLYKIISKCWAGDMNKRPDFTELRLVRLKFIYKSQINLRGNVLHHYFFLPEVYIQVQNDQ